MPARGQKQPELETATALSGVLALLVAEREERLRNGDRSGVPKTEVLLANAGLKTEEISRLMGKKVDAVRKTLQRERR